MKTFNKTNNIHFIKIVTAVAILIAVFTLSLAGCSPNKSGALENDFAAEIINTEFVKLAIGAAVANTIDNSVSKTLTAAVLPETATNKAVDWVAQWGDETMTANVSEYLTVTPSSDGSTTATVTCKKAFTGTIIVTVTTRESGYSASCVVSFVGIPTNIVLNGAVSTSGEVLKLGIGKIYAFTVDLTNVFQSVGSQFKDITCEITGVGSMVLSNCEHYNATGKDIWYDSKNKTVTLDSLKASFLSMSQENNQLTIKTIRSIESYYALLERIDGGRTLAYTDKFRSFVDDCYFNLIIKENVSGLSKVYQIRFDSSIVTGVNMGFGEMQF